MKAKRKISAKSVERIVGTSLQETYRKPFAVARRATRFATRRARVAAFRYGAWARRASGERLNTLLSKRSAWHMRCPAWRQATFGGASRNRERQGGNAYMLWIIVIILLIIGLLGGRAVNDLFYLLCVVALVIFVINFITGRRAD